MGAVGVIIERIPHNTVAYAYLEIQAANANEFESLREEALKRIPQYAFALGQPAEPKVVSEPEVTAEAPQVDEAPAAPPAEAKASEGRGVADLPPSAAGSDAPTSRPSEGHDPNIPSGASMTEGLSPREIARQRLAQKG